MSDVFYKYTHEIDVLTIFFSSKTECEIIKKQFCFGLSMWCTRENKILTMVIDSATVNIFDLFTRERDDHDIRTLYNVFDDVLMVEFTTFGEGDVEMFEVDTNVHGIFNKNCQWVGMMITKASEVIA